MHYKLPNLPKNSSTTHYDALLRSTICIQRDPTYVLEQPPNLLYHSQGVIVNHSHNRNGNIMMNSPLNLSTQVQGTNKSIIMTSCTSLFLQNHNASDFSPSSIAINMLRSIYTLLHIRIKESLPVPCSDHTRPNHHC